MYLMMMLRVSFVSKTMNPHERFILGSHSPDPHEEKVFVSEMLRLMLYDNSDQLHDMAEVRRNLCAINN